LLAEEYKLHAWNEEEREQSPELANWVFETRCEIEEADDQDEILAMQMQL
jgi:hypothetical protein